MGASKKKKDNRYYAVVCGRVNEPTIFSSWGDVHPLVTFYPNNVFKGFHTLDEACKYMEAKGVHQYSKVIKQTALDTTTDDCSEGYYAVANGAKRGIHSAWYGREGAFKETDKWEGACHKYFKTKAQAEAFIQNWEDSIADVCNMELDSRLGPQNTQSEDLATLLRFGDNLKTEGSVEWL